MMDRIEKYETALRIQIAEYCGWEWKEQETGYCWHTPSGQFWGRRLFRDDSITGQSVTKEMMVDSLPPYLTSHDAMDDAVATLTTESDYSDHPTNNEGVPESEYYSRALCEVLGFNIIQLTKYYWKLLRATPKQKAIAFVLAKEKSGRGR